MSYIYCINIFNNENNNLFILILTFVFSIVLVKRNKGPAKGDVRFHADFVRVAPKSGRSRDHRWTWS